MLRKFQRLTIALCIFCLPVAAHGATGNAPSKKLPPAVIEAQKAYKQALLDIEKDHSEKIHAAWEASDNKLEEALKQSMKLADLEGSNRITALRAELTSEILAGRAPKPVELPKNPSALAARNELLAAVQKIDSASTLAMEKAAKTCLDSLDQSSKSALQSGDLDTANAIAAARKQFESQTKLAGRFPPDPIAVYTFDRDTFIKKDGKELVRDLSGNENHLVAENVKPAPGRINGAISCTGDKSRLVSQKPIGIAGDQERSLLFYTSFEAIPEGRWKHFLGWGEPVEKHSFHASLFEGKYMLWAHGFGNDYAASASPTPKVWTQHLITYNGKATFWYVDGKPITPPKGFEIKYETTDTPLTIGGIPITLDELAIYNRTLTPEEIPTPRSRAPISPLP